LGEGAHSPLAGAARPRPPSPKPAASAAPLCPSSPRPAGPGWAQDSFYRTLSPEEIALVAANSYNFDVPDALDRPQLLAVLQALREGRPVDVPIYDFATHSRSTETRRVGG
jgi:hypothetical protein